MKCIKQCVERLVVLAGRNVAMLMSSNGEVKYA